MKITPQQVFSIDIGSTYATLSHFGETGQSSIICNPDGDLITDSAVFFEDKNTWIMGASARRSAATAPENFVDNILLELGTGWKKVFYGIEHSPETILSLIIKYMVNGAELQGYDVRNVIITHPDWLEDESQLQSLKKAAELIELNVVDMVCSSVATVCGYDCHRLPDSAEEETRHVLVYHLGGYSCAVSRVQVTANGVSRICVYTHKELGGDKWNQVLREIVLEKLQEQEVDTEFSRDPELSSELDWSVERMKKSLTQRDAASERIRIADGSRPRISVSREEFEQRSQHLLKDALDLLIYEKSARRVGIRIDDILLEGGAVFMPRICNALQEFCSSSVPGVEFRMHEPNFVAGKGALVYLSEILSGRWQSNQPWDDRQQLTGVPVPEPMPHVRYYLSSDVEIRLKGDMQQLASAIIEKGEFLPLSGEFVYRCAPENVEVLLRPLGTCLFLPIASRRNKYEQLSYFLTKVQYSLDEEGLMRLSVASERSGIRRNITCRLPEDSVQQKIVHPDRLSEEEMEGFKRELEILLI